MSNEKTGGPAFPFPGEPNIHAGCSGMDLRDYFAAKAMHAIYTRFGGTPSAGDNYDVCLDMAARDAYSMADAMIRAREVK